MNISLKKIAILGTLILVLFVSGCVQEEQDTGVDIAEQAVTYGLFITDFSSLPEVDSEDTIDINLDVKNVGESDATSIEVDLYQHGGFTLVEGDWKKQTSLLLEADPKIQTEGETYSTYWTVEAPKVTTDQYKSFKGRITYDYSTDSISNVYLVDREEWKEKGEFAFLISTASSVGPVSLKIVPPPPLKINEPVPEKEVSLDILIENTGHGRVEDSNITEFWTRVNGKEIESTCSSYNITGIKLFGTDQERSLRCDMNLSYSGVAVSHIVEVGIKYRYYFDTPPINIKIEEVK